MSAPLHLVTDEDFERQIRQIKALPPSAAHSLLEQLLCTAVLTLLNEQSRLKRRVSDLEGRENV